MAFLPGNKTGPTKPRPPTNNPPGSGGGSLPNARDIAAAAAALAGQVATGQIPKPEAPKPKPKPPTALTLPPPPPSSGMTSSVSDRYMDAYKKALEQQKQQAQQQVPQGVIQGSAPKIHPGRPTVQQQQQIILDQKPPKPIDAMAGGSSGKINAPVGGKATQPQQAPLPLWGGPISLQDVMNTNFNPDGSPKPIDPRRPPVYEQQARIRNQQNQVLTAPPPPMNPTLPMILKQPPMAPDPATLNIKPPFMAPQWPVPGPYANVFPQAGPGDAASIAARMDAMANASRAQLAPFAYTPEQQMMANMPWNAYMVPGEDRPFANDAEGMAWAESYRAQTGMWPWEGPFDETTNFRNALLGSYDQAAGVPPAEDVIAAEDEIQYLVPPGTEYYPPVEEPYYDPGYGGGGFYGGGFGGGGGGGYSTPANPWYFVNMMRGV